MILLKVDNIHVYYGAIHAIKGISFEVEEGEIVTLIGANGAGKSTTLNTVAGLLKPRSGTITLEGKSIVGFGPDSVDVLAIVTLEQLGLKYINSSKKADDWTNQKFVDWVNFWKKAENEGYFQLVDSEGYHSGPFGNQNYFCYMGSSAGMGYITPNGFTIVTGPVPQVAGGKEYTEITTRALISFTKDEATDAGTAEFVKYFTKPENNLPFCQKYSASTPYKDVEESPVYKEYFDKSIANQALASMLSYAGTRPSVSGERGAREALVAAMKKIIIDNEDPTAALTQAVATANGSLSE